VVVGSAALMASDHISNALVASKTGDGVPCLRAAGRPAAPR